MEGEFGARHFLVSTELRSVKALAFQAVALHVTCSEEGIIQQHSSNVDQISPVLLRVLCPLPYVSFQGLPVSLSAACSLPLLPFCSLEERSVDLGPLCGPTVPLLCILCVYRKIKQKHA